VRSFGSCLALRIGEFLSVFAFEMPRPVVDLRIFVADEDRMPVDQ